MTMELAHVIFISALFVLLQENVLKGQSVNDYVEVIDSVLDNYYRSRCVILLYGTSENTSDFQEKGVLVEVADSMHRIGRTVLCSVDLEIYNHNSKRFLCQNLDKPLNILMSSNAVVQQKLKTLSRIATLSRAAWLLFLNWNISIQNFFSDIYVPFDCKFLVAQTYEKFVHLTEVYRVAPGMSLATYPYGRWNKEEKQSYITAEAFYERRKNLHGFKMKGLTINNPPIIKVPVNYESLSRVDGYIGNVWSEIENILNFTTEFKVDAAYGRLTNGSWNGMMEALRTGNTDIALSALTMTQQRLDIVDFIFPIFDTRYHIYIRQPMSESYTWSDFLGPFSGTLWITVCCSILVLSVFLYKFHHFGRSCGNEEIQGILKYSFYDSVYYVFGIFCQKGHEFTPTATSCRLVYLTAYLTAVVLFSAYSGGLVSHLTKKTIKLAFTDLKGLMEDGNYKLGVLAASAEYGMFSDSNIPIMKKVHDKMLKPENSMPMTYEEGIKRLCSRSKYALVATIQYTTGLQVACRISVLPDESFPASNAIAVTKDSPYRDILSYNLEILRGGGKLHRLRSKWWKPTLLQEKEPWEVIGLNRVASILVALIFGICTSGILLVLERWWQSRRSRKTPSVLKFSLDEQS